MPFNVVIPQSPKQETTCMYMYMYSRDAFKQSAQSTASLSNVWLKWFHINFIAQVFQALIILQCKCYCSCSHFYFTCSILTSFQTDVVYQLVLEAKHINYPLYDLHCVCDVLLFCMCACFFAKIEILQYNYITIILL